MNYYHTLWSDRRDGTEFWVFIAFTMGNHTANNSNNNNNTPCSTVLLEKLTGFQLVKFPTLYGTLS